MKKRTLMSWSSGKDSAWALYQLQQDPDIELVGLFSTVNREYDRVAMHGVRVELLQEQARCIGLPLDIIEIPNPCSNSEYEKVMGEFIQTAKNDDIDYIAFGDLYLESIRNYREEKLKGSGIQPIFPIWGTPTDLLAKEMINSGLKTVITCIDPKIIPERFAGALFDNQLLDSLPGEVDPCGENGEFHSFAFDGPMFKDKLEIQVGEIVHRDNFIFADILRKGI